MLKQAVNAASFVQPEQERIPADVSCPSDPETDNGSDFESRWTPVAMCLAMSNPEMDG